VHRDRKTTAIKVGFSDGSTSLPHKYRDPPPLHRAAMRQCAHCRVSYSTCLRPSSRHSRHSFFAAFNLRIRLMPASRSLALRSLALSGGPTPRSLALCSSRIDSQARYMGGSMALWRSMAAFNTGVDLRSPLGGLSGALCSLARSLARSLALSGAPWRSLAHSGALLRSLALSGALLRSLVSSTEHPPF